MEGGSRDGQRRSPLERFTHVSQRPPASSDTREPFAALWIWHIPLLFNAAVRHDGIHFLQHLAFFGTAALFWWALVRGRYGRLGYGIAVLYVFATAMHSAILGALLTVAPGVVYEVYDVPVAASTAAALEDQQLAGLLMWVPSNVVFIGLGLALFAAWLAESDRRLAIGRRP